MEPLKYRGFGIELRAILSDEPSYFSKKRVESAISFSLVMLAYIVYMVINIRTITPYEFTVVSGAVMAYGWGTVRQIQKEKKNDSNESK